MFKDSENLMGILKKGVNNQMNPEKIDNEIVENMDDFDEGTLILDEGEIFDEEDFPEYMVDTSIRGSNEPEIVEELDFLDSDDMVDYDVDPFGDSDMSVLVEKKGTNALDLSNIKEISDEELEEDFLDDDFDDFEGYDESDENSDSFDELDWNDNSFDDIDSEILEEEKLLQEKYDFILEEEEIEEIEEPEVKEVKEETELDKDDKFSNCVFKAGMSIDEYLRANPNYREKMYIEHFFKKSVIDEALLKGLIFVKKGRFML